MSTQFASEIMVVRGALSEHDKYYTGFTKAMLFHKAFGLPVNAPGYQPDLADRELRGRLMLEEVVEFLTKGLGLQATYDGCIIDLQHIKLMQSEIHQYDPVETLDGICDIKVIANGTGVVMGLPVQDGDWEVYASNMSKLDADGKSIVNGENGVLDQRFPIGKVLKPDNYIPANIAGIIERVLQD